MVTRVGMSWSSEVLGGGYPLKDVVKLKILRGNQQHIKKAASGAIQKCDSGAQESANQSDANAASSDYVRL